MKEMCELSDSAIKSIIENREIVLVQWPSNSDVLSASAMKKKLKSCMFKEYPVIIHAQGDWTEMSQKRKHFEKYGTLSQNKKDRSSRKVKDISADYVSGPSNNDSLEKKSASTKVLKKQKGENKQRKSEAILAALEEAENYDDSFDSDSERSIDKLGLSQLNTKVYVLQEENKRYREEIHLFRTMKTLSEDLQHMKLLSDGVIKNLEIAKKITCPLNIEDYSKNTQMAKILSSREIYTYQQNSSQKTTTMVNDKSVWEVRAPKDDFVHDDDVLRNNGVRKDNHDLHHDHVRNNVLHHDDGVSENDLRDNDIRNNNDHNDYWRYDDVRNTGGRSNDQHNGNECKVYSRKDDEHIVDGRSKDEANGNERKADGRKADGRKDDGREADGRKVDGRKDDGREDDGRKYDGPKDDGGNNDTGHNDDGPVYVKMETLSESNIENAEEVESTENDENLTELLDTGVKVNKCKLEKCNKLSFSKFVTDLLVVVFGKNVLAESCISGKVCNAAKKKNSTAKKPLDKAKLDAVKRYAVSICGPQTDIDKSFKTIVRNKCNNCDKAMKLQSAPK